MTERSALDAVGGADAVRAVVNRFCDLMELHQQRLSAAFANTADWMRSKGG